MAQIALDATVEWYAAHGNDLTAAQNYALTVMAGTSTIFDTEFLVQLEVPYFRIWEAEPDPYTEGSSDTVVLLDEIRLEWNANQIGVDRTVAHLITHEPSTQRGRAYVDRLCDNVIDPGDSYDYGANIMRAAGNTVSESRLLAHELGHSSSSPHTHCYVPEIDQCANAPDCYQPPIVQTESTLMSYCDDRITEFHQRVKGEKLRPAAEPAFPACIDTAGLPGDLRMGGGGLTLDRPAFCPGEVMQTDDGDRN